MTPATHTEGRRPTRRGSPFPKKFFRGFAPGPHSPFGVFSHTSPNTRSTILAISHPLRLKRGQIGRARGLDVTVKSAAGFARHFAPTWQMVTAYKAGRLAAAEYAAEYRRILGDAPLCAWHALREAGLNRRSLRLLCYCRDGAFCHTHLLIDYAVSHFPRSFSDGRAPEDIPMPPTESPYRFTWDCSYQGAADYTVRGDGEPYRLLWRRSAPDPQLAGYRPGVYEREILPAVGTVRCYSPSRHLAEPVYRSFIAWLQREYERDLARHRAFRAEFNVPNTFPPPPVWPRPVVWDTETWTLHTPSWYTEEPTP